MDFPFDSIETLKVLKEWLSINETDVLECC